MPDANTANKLLAMLNAASSSPFSAPAPPPSNTNGNTPPPRSNGQSQGPAPPLAQAHISRQPSGTSSHAFSPPGPSGHNLTPPLPDGPHPSAPGVSVSANRQRTPSATRSFHLANSASASPPVSGPGTTSPREPTPAPPGPGIISQTQTASLQNLFASLTGSGTSMGSGSGSGSVTAGAGISPAANALHAAPGQSQEGAPRQGGSALSPPPHGVGAGGGGSASQADRLLGMLRAGAGIGPTPFASSPAAAPVASASRSFSAASSFQDQSQSQSQNQSLGMGSHGPRERTVSSGGSVGRGGAPAPSVSTAAVLSPGTAATAAPISAPAPATPSSKGSTHSQGLLDLFKGIQTPTSQTPNHGTSAPVTSHSHAPSPAPSSLGPAAAAAAASIQNDGQEEREAQRASPAPAPHVNGLSEPGPTQHDHAEDPFSNDHEVAHEHRSVEWKEDVKDGEAEPATAAQGESDDNVEDAGAGSRVASDNEDRDSTPAEERHDALQPSSTPSAPAPTEVAPKKTMFDFVSPFDLMKSINFGSAAQAPPAAKQSPAAKGDLTSANTKDAVPTVVTASGPTVIGGPLKEGKAAKTDRAQPPAAPASVASSAGRAPPSDAGSNKTDATTKADLAGTWQVNKVVGGREGHGPRAFGADIRIDLSQPGLASLVSDRDIVQVVPTTIVKSAELGYRAGRAMGMTADWLAYGLSKGKIRLIDRSSGARIVLNLTGAAASGPIIDLAVAPTQVAVVAADHSVHVYKVPQTWYKDDPPVEKVLSLASSRGADEIGLPFKVEWVRKGSEFALAVGAKHGVLLFAPSADWAGKSFGEVARLHKVLTAEGELVDFCLNHTHQAVGIISSGSIFSLYSVSTLNRVWHRAVPTSVPGSTPSSILFCESNILIGRDRGVAYDLVQITVDLSVLGSIHLTAPPPCSPELHYAHAVYDARNTTVWLAPLARGSLYGFRYALKGRPPARPSQGDKVVPFDAGAEVPLEPVLMLTLGPGSEEEDAEVFVAHPNGYSVVTLDGGLLVDVKGVQEGKADALGKEKANVVDRRAQSPASDVATVGARSIPKVQTPNEDRQVEDAQPAREAIGKPAEPLKANANANPSIEPAAPVPAPDMARRGSKSGAKPAASGQASTGKAASAAGASPAKETVKDEGGVSAKELKKVEDRIVTQTRQALSSHSDKILKSLDAISGEKIAADVGGRLERQLKVAMGVAVRDEIKKSMGPAMQNELRSSLPRAIAEILPAEVERVVLPIVQRHVPMVVQASIERAMHDAVGRVIVPALTRATDQAFEGLAEDLRSEILQVRKDLSPAPQNDHSAVMQQMADSLADLQRQVASLGEQLAKHSQPQAPVAPSPATVRSPPAPAQIPQPIPILSTQPATASPPNLKQLEDTFLGALAANTTASTIALITQQHRVVDVCLPQPPARSPLSPSVLLTLLHRLALVLSEVVPGPGQQGEIFGRCLLWETRVAVLVDLKHPDTGRYATPVAELVLRMMGELGVRLEGMGMTHAAGGVRGVVEILGRKL